MPRWKGRKHDYDEDGTGIYYRVRNATLKDYRGAPHGLAYTHKDQLNADLLEFLKT